MPYFQFEKITVGFVDLYVWGFFVALGFLVSFLLLLNATKKENLANPNLIPEGFIWIILGSLIFAKIGGGFSSLWGIFGGLASVILYFKFKKLNFDLFLKLADLSAPFIALGLAIGRIGCFLINDHMGVQTFLPWGIVWPDGSVRHPVALYLIVSNLVLFLILSRLKIKFRAPGQLFLFLWIIYFLSRFLLDFTREESGYFEIFYHLLFAILFLISLLIYMVRFKKPRGA